MKVRQLSHVLALATAASGLLIAASVTPALAGDTPAEFSVTAGSLSISVPTGLVNLGSVTDSVLGSSVSSPLGQVKVSDARGILATNWLAAVSASDFASVDAIVAASNVGYSAGEIASAGPGSLGALFLGHSYADIGTIQSAVATLDITGNNSATWNPTVSVFVTPGTTVATYTGSITHSVA